MKNLELSKIGLGLGLSLVASLILTTGCVLTPTGEIITPPVSVDAEINLEPRIHLGTRSSVSVWLHPTYIVSDAYPIAQNHCSRWGLYAKPRYDWSISSSGERYLDYVCVGRRPHLSDIHIIGGRHHRRYYRRHRRHYPNRRVYTPKPIPRVSPIRRRKTFGRNSSYAHSKPRRSTTVERGQSWEHNSRKSKIRSSRPVRRPRRTTVVERGKAWEHNTGKRFKKQFRPLKKRTKRSTFGSAAFKVKPRGRGFSRSLKVKKQPSKKRTLRL